LITSKLCRPEGTPAIEKWPIMIAEGAQMFAVDLDQRTRTEERRGCGVHDDTMHGDRGTIRVCGGRFIEWRRLCARNSVAVSRENNEDAAHKPQTNRARFGFHWIRGRILRFAGELFGS